MNKNIERFRPALKEVRPDLNKLMIITGIPGSGKDYLLEKTLGQSDLDGSPIQIFSFGELLYKKIKARKQQMALQSRDDMRTMLTQEEIAQFVAQVIAEILEEIPALVNTHVAYKQNEAIVVNKKSFQEMNPLTFLYVWADPEQIAEWRTDPERIRDQESPEDLALHQAIAYEATYQLAQYLGSRFVTVHNQVGEGEAAVATIQHEVEQISKQ